MYQLNPPSVYILDRALADPRSARRVQRMVAALGWEGRAQCITDADIPEVIRTQEWQGTRRRQGTNGAHADPSIVFSTMRFEETPDATPLWEACPEGTARDLVATLLGRGGKVIHRERKGDNRICRQRYQYDTLFGCPHGCRYCGAGKVAVIHTNLEEFLERQVAPTAQAHPEQKVFMFNSALSDTLSFEPEYGLARLMGEYFASTPDQYFLIHTKSANVEFLRDIDHQGHTILVWSLTSATVSRQVEPGSGTTEERIEAARIAQGAGYPVRFKFKPIVPVRGWREEAREMIALLFEKVRPDNVGMCTIAWMPAPDLLACLGEEMLDPECVRRIRAHAAEAPFVQTGPLPPDLRAEIYSFYVEEIRKHDKEVPVFLSTETPEMWREFAPRLGMEGKDYVCACGPQCVPGMRRLPRLWEPAEVRA